MLEPSARRSSDNTLNMVIPFQKNKWTRIDLSCVSIFFELVKVFGSQFMRSIDLLKKLLNVVKRWRQRKLYGLEQRNWNSINHRTNVAYVG